MSSRITDMDLRNGLSIWTINIVDNWFLRKGNNPGSWDSPIYDDNVCCYSRTQFITLIINFDIMVFNREIVKAHRK